MNYNIGTTKTAQVLEQRERLQELVNGIYKMFSEIESACSAVLRQRQEKTASVNECPNEDVACEPSLDMAPLAKELLLINRRLELLIVLGNNFLKRLEI